MQAFRQCFISNHDNDTISDKIVFHITSTVVAVVGQTVKTSDELFSELTLFLAASIQSHVFEDNVLSDLEKASNLSITFWYFLQLAAEMSVDAAYLPHVHPCNIEVY